MKHPMVLANAIIAGTNKAGTTSLFRYLSDHPEVCASNIKEISFFSGLQGELTPRRCHVTPHTSLIARRKPEYGWRPAPITCPAALA
jgi:hypothetical protein